MSTDESLMREVGERIRGLREACEVSEEDMAKELEVDLETYMSWENSGADVPISAIYHKIGRAHV